MTLSGIRLVRITVFRKNRGFHTSNAGGREETFMIAISLAALVAITWLLLPKNSEKMKPIQIGLSVAILLGWITLPRLLASFWLNPFLGINFGPTDSVFQDEMQETGIILLGGLWMLIATVIFPLMQLGTALWQRLFKMSPSGSNPPSKQPTLCL